MYQKQMQAEGSFIAFPHQIQSPSSLSMERKPQVRTRNAILCSSHFSRSPEQERDASKVLHIATVLSWHLSGFLLVGVQCTIQCTTEPCLSHVGGPILSQMLMLSHPPTLLLPFMLIALRITKVTF